MVNQPKRISIISDAPTAAGSQVHARFGPGTGNIIRRLTNYHNIWAGLMVEPVDAAANAHGLWVLWLKANTNNPDTEWSLAEILAEDSSMEVIACGLWGASNETPFNMQPMHLNSSRNLVANQELVFTCRIFGVTAGAVRIVCSLCAGISVK